MSSQALELRRFYDRLAERIVQFGIRLVCGDFNMDCLRVLHELRARGFLANVACWFAWRRNGGEFSQKHTAILGSSQMVLDSVLIIVIGPSNGLRLPFNEEVFGIARNPPLSRIVVGR